MQIMPVKTRGSHAAIFRYNEWAELIGVVIIPQPSGEQRLCYKVRFDDGVIDYRPVSDANNYEFKAAD